MLYIAEVTIPHISFKLYVTSLKFRSEKTVNMKASGFKTEIAAQ